MMRDFTPPDATPFRLDMQIFVSRLE